MRALAVGAVLVAILAGIVALVTPPTPRAKVDECGEERWGVKTLTDTTTKPGAGDIDVAHPVTTTVEKLRKLNDKGKVSNGKPPKNLSGDTPRKAPVETTVYKVKALLMSMRREDDKDIHLVIADPKIGGSMIVEFPDASCTTEATAARRTDMESALDGLKSACNGVPAIGSEKVVTLQGKVSLSGVGFFDLIHGQGGVATNGIELHPVLSFNASSCSRIFNP